MAIGSTRKFAAQAKGKSRGNANHSTSSKANAAGYAKRASRRAKTSTLGVEDVYDYAPSFRGTKRANVSMTLDKDEEDNYDRGEGRMQGDDDDEEERREKMRPRLIGEGEEGEMIDEDDDEEIDSDDAFEESDEERFAGFKFPTGKNSKRKDKSPSKSVRFAQVDLNEDDNGAMGEEDSASSSQQESDEEEEGEDDEFIDLLDILDGKGEPDLGDDDAVSALPVDRVPLSAAKEQRKLSKEVGDDISDANFGSQEDEEGDESEADDDGDDDEEDEEIHVSASEDEDPDGDAIANLDNFISKLEGGTKRKADESNAGGGVASDTRPKKKRIVQERTEGGVEGVFGTRATGSTKLSLADLLTPLATSSTVLTSLKKSTKVLTSSSEKNKPLPAPLPQRSQERVDREAAYEETKKEVDKWNDTIKRIKEAEHISFPLQQQSLGKPSNLELAAKFKPTTELETAVDRLLKSAKLREEDITRTEELKMNHLSVEEVAERRAELRKMRDLMFRAEVKARRVAKIKSKTYRRIQKKAKAREGAGGGDGEDDDEGDEARMKREVERARERATLKHKNTGKWAKQMKARGELDEDQRRDVNEMLERGEKLRRRIRGEGSEDGDSGDRSDSGSDDDDGGEDGEDGVLRIKKSAFDELEKIRAADMGGLDGNDPDADVTLKAKAKSVFEMKFMKDAAARQDQQVDKDIDDFRREMGVIEDNDGDDATEEERDEANVAVQRVGGRVTFRPGATVGASTRIPLPMPSASQLSDTSTLKSSPPLTSPLTSMYDRQMPPPPSLLSSRNAIQKEPAKQNPWLAIADGEGPSTSKIARKRNEVVVGKDSSTAEKSAHALVKSKKKTEAEREKESEDAAVDIDMDDVLLLEPPAAKAVDGAKLKSKKEKSRKKKKGKGVQGTEQVNGDGDEDSNSEVEAQEAIANGGKPPRILAFQQRDLVARAFAGDNVVREFEEAKRREIESDAPCDEDTTLAGWGAWGGTGTKKAKAKPHLIKHIPGIAPTARADAGKAHIIISEKRDKKAAKYVIRDLPYPYTSKAQFERSMETPIGVEWNTRVGFQRATVPRVVKKVRPYSL
ncbi:Utp14-domain-containing protein [Rickenella mellea]|uniref:Utp14-domain-containing protein n=1 Tax=Rickenella mellea TaxID=50990 RepID=A0A4Y7QHM3_9AGAM|nr:Utp14-domain-containing protein [Rickenella mellea]